MNCVPCVHILHKCTRSLFTKKKKKTELVLTLRIRYIDFSLPALNVQNLKFTDSMACHGSILLDPSWCSLIPES